MIWFVDGMVDGTDYPDFLIDCSLLHVYINIVYFPFYIFRYLDKYGYPLNLWLVTMIMTLRMYRLAGRTLLDTAGSMCVLCNR